jgi:hypothetical protein
MVMILTGYAYISDLEAGGVEGCSLSYADHLNENEMNIWRIGFFHYQNQVS